MSAPDEYVKRIEALKRDPLRLRPDLPAELEGLRRKLRGATGASQPAAAQPPATRPPEPILYRRDLPRSGPRPAPPEPAGPPVPLHEALPGEEVTAPCGGSAYVVTQRLAPPEGRSDRLGGPLCACLANPDSRVRRLLAARCGMERVRPEQLLFLDLETTGLGSATIFLVGALAWEGDAFVIRQYLARDYSEERAITALFAEGLDPEKLLVSFNGKSFDLPYLRMRAAAHRVAFPEGVPHLDLLHESRRAWKGRLPDCRLQTLERAFCGRMRHDDIPGAEIPEAYHRFVRTGSAAEMARIAEHNRLDLLTLAELLLRLPAPS